MKCILKHEVKVLVAQLCLTPCTHMNYSPPGSSVHEFSRQEHWSGLPFPSPGDVPTKGLNLGLAVIVNCLISL